ncbi:MAG: fructose-bisphosphate aldolase class I [Legionella sp.]|nr:fructose-bisphosphate aldolase class I [Legionella sp.]
MHQSTLAATIQQLTQHGKGILAADESTGTIGKRFATIGVENTAENRRRYRRLLAKTHELGKYIHGVILFEETFDQADENGTSLAECFAQQGIVPGIKIDRGLVTLAHSDQEQITQGLDGIEERLEVFKQKGARFAKWRNVYHISEQKPSPLAIHSGAEVLARYAAACQSIGIVPIVEPEILIDGEHSIERCADAAKAVISEVFRALFLHNVALEHIVLKPSMVTCGKKTIPFSATQSVAIHTLKVFHQHVPAAVPTINFLSGGQTPSQATANLNAMNQQGHQPWILSFSYGRALQEECLSVWRGEDSREAAAQEALLKRAYLNSLACFGEYSASMEP